MPFFTLLGKILPEGVRRGGRIEELAPGIGRSTLAGFPLFHLEFSRLPMEEAYYPFHLFGREENVRGVIEALLERPDLRGRYLREVVVLHIELLEEVLKMKGTSLEELEIDLAAIIRLIGEEKIIREIGKKRGVIWRLSKRSRWPDCTDG